MASTLSMLKMCRYHKQSVNKGANDLFIFTSVVTQSVSQLNGHANHMSHKNERYLSQLYNNLLPLKWERLDCYHTKKVCCYC